MGSAQKTDSRPSFEKIIPGRLGHSVVTYTQEFLFPFRGNLRLSVILEFPHRKNDDTIGNNKALKFCRMVEKHSPK
jgi:hypothetical protein